MIFRAQKPIGHIRIHVRATFHGGLDDGGQGYLRRGIDETGIGQSGFGQESLDGFAQSLRVGQLVEIDFEVNQEAFNASIRIMDGQMEPKLPNE